MASAWRPKPKAVRSASRPRPAPSREELEETLAYLCARVCRWVARRGLLRNDDASKEAPAYSLREPMTLAGMQRFTLETAKDTGEPAESEPPEPAPRVTEAVVYERFNLHASVHVLAHDDLLRERLCRYLARPAFSHARLALRRDGLVVYRVKKAGRRRVKQRAMSPRECLARLAAHGPSAELSACSLARGACASPRTAGERRAAAAGIACMVHEVVGREEGLALRGRCGSGASGSPCAAGAIHPDGGGNWRRGARPRGDGWAPSSTTRKDEAHHDPTGPEPAKSTSQRNSWRSLMTFPLVVKVIALGHSCAGRATHARTRCAARNCGDFQPQAGHAKVTPPFAGNLSFSRSSSRMRSELCDGLSLALEE